MTADGFTDAARAYAEQACYQDENIPIAEAGFRAGWKAARAYLAEQGEDPAGPLRPLSTDERSYRYAQDLGYELPEDPR